MGDAPVMGDAPAPPGPPPRVMGNVPSPPSAQGQVVGSEGSAKEDGDGTAWTTVVDVEVAWEVAVTPW